MLKGGFVTLSKLQGDILALLVGLDRVCGEQSCIAQH